MRRTLADLSPKLIRNTHPKNNLKYHPQSPGFYRAKKSASRMKWNFNVPYRREVDSLLHYPDISRVTGKRVDWCHGEPDDGYEGARIYGEHTLELTNLPLGRTPEYMQERLRRFFSKFGPVVHCRAEPHPLDPYQCEGKGFVSFRDKPTALKALRAPLKFPAALHDKVISMRHLDSDKRNDPDYREKARFWDNELIALARQLHAKLSGDPTLKSEGVPLADVGRGLFERELVLPPTPPVGSPAPDPVRGRGGVPVSKGLYGAPTRRVPAGPAVRRRFGSWHAFLAEPPLDQLFSIERRPGSGGAEADAEGVVVVRPLLVTTTQRTRMLARLRMVLAGRLQAEFSVWWRQGKIPLPEYTQRRVTWWDHKPHLPFELQIMSRSGHRHRIFDERFLFKMQLLRARNEKRKERRSEWNEKRKEMLEEKKQAVQQRRDRALAAVEGAKCKGLLGGFSPQLLRAAGRGAAVEGP